MSEEEEDPFLGRRQRGRERAMRLFGEVAYSSAHHPEADLEEVTDELVEEVRKRTLNGVQGFRAWAFNQPLVRQNAIIRLVSGFWVSDALAALDRLKP